MIDSTTWTNPLYLGVGLGALIFGLGVFIVCVRAAGLLGRLGQTLDEVDKQLGNLSAPIATTLTHVGGIADTADSTIARLGAAVGRLEDVAGGATKTADLIGSTLSGLSAALRKSKPGGPANAA
ncbi:MAG: hypothetical protein ACREM2_05295 [Vulcanimicrobiaceae bacterium]